MAGHCGDGEELTGCAPISNKQLSHLPIASSGALDNRPARRRLAWAAEPLLAVLLDIEEGVWPRSPAMPRIIMDRMTPLSFKQETGHAELPPTRW